RRPSIRLETARSDGGAAKGRATEVIDPGEFRASAHEMGERRAADEGARPRFIRIAAFIPVDLPQERIRIVKPEQFAENAGAAVRRRNKPRIGAEIDKF